MSHENAKIVESVYAAYARRDVPAVLNMTDPEFEVVQTQLLPWGGHYQGRDGLQRFLGLLMEYVEGLPQIEEYVEAGEQVVAIGRLRGKVKTTGKSFDIRIVHLWTVRQSRLVRFQAYIDTPAMLEALGA